MADEILTGVELEFNVMDELYSRLTEREVSYKVQSSKIACPPDGRELYRIASNHGYYRSEPNDHLYSIRNEIVGYLNLLDINVKYHHHEVGSSQSEIEFNFMPIEKSADAVVLAKNISHRIAKKHNKVISFLPKIIPGEAGNGMHVHQFLLKDGNNVFYDKKGIYNLSQTALYYIGGILKHIKSLTAFTNPTSNSYRRLIPGLEAPTKAVFAEGNRSAAIRIPAYIQDTRETRIELRTVDATCNPYLAFCAMLMAGLDGIRRKIDPIKEGFGPIEKNIYDLSEEELKKIVSLPDSLEDALNCLKSDYEYLLYGDVFSIDLIEKWINVKMKDIQDMRKVPHPWEIARYYDM